MIRRTRSYSMSDISELGVRRGKLERCKSVPNFDGSFFSQLDARDVKYNKKNTIFIDKSAPPEITKEELKLKRMQSRYYHGLVWLENGHLEFPPKDDKREDKPRYWSKAKWKINASGLCHILDQHGNQFKQLKISIDEIPQYIMEAVKNGRIIGSQKGRNGEGRPVYEFTYKEQKHYLAITIGDNGYIVGANPTSLSSLKPQEKQ